MQQFGNNMMSGPKTIWVVSGDVEEQGPTVLTPSIPTARSVYEYRSEARQYHFTIS